MKRIADGDTITVVDVRDVNTKVRFACIDAAVPHTNQEKESYDPVDLDQFKWQDSKIAKIGFVKGKGDWLTL